MRAAALLAVAVLACALAGCGSTGRSAPRPTTTSSAPAPPAGTPTVRAAAGPPRLQAVRIGATPAPVQLPGLAATGGQVHAVGGLDAGDASVAGIVRLAPGRPAVTGSLPQAAHDIGVAALGGALYAFGGGTAAGPTSTITRITPSGQVSRAGTLPVADVRHGGGDARRDDLRRRRLHDDDPLRSVLAFRPGQPSATWRRSRTPSATPPSRRSVAVCSSPAGPTGPAPGRRSSASTPHVTASG